MPAVENPANSPVSRFSAYKIWVMQCKENIVRFEVEWMGAGAEKLCIFNGKLAIYRKLREIGSRLLLITNRKWHIGFQMTWKSLILDDLGGQYCNRNCMGCSASFLATARPSLLFVCLLQCTHLCFRTLSAMELGASSLFLPLPSFSSPSPPLCLSLSLEVGPLNTS